MTSTARKYAYAQEQLFQKLTNLQKKYLISSLVNFSVLVSLLHRLINCQLIELIYANLWQVPCYFCSKPHPRFVTKIYGKRCNVYVGVHAIVFVVFFPFLICITMYLRKFMLSRILSHNKLFHHIFESNQWPALSQYFPRLL